MWRGVSIPFHLSTVAVPTQAAGSGRRQRPRCGHEPGQEEIPRSPPSPGPGSCRASAARTPSQQRFASPTACDPLPAAAAARPDRRRHTAAPPAYPAGLTAREVEVLRLVAQGLPNSAVAARLFLAPRTVNTHLTNIYTKLGVDNRAAATRFALEHGLA